MAATEKLFELQKVDVTWDKVRRRLQQIQQQLGETEELKGARQRVTETETELHLWRGKQKDGELESHSLANRIKATEERLMSGQIHNPKELETLQASLDALQRLHTGIEDSAVDALMKADELASLLTDQQSSLAQVENAWSSGQEELRQEEAKQKQNYVLLKRKRESLAVALGPELLDRYEQMRKRKAGIAVAALHQDSMCSACHVRVPTGIASNVRSAGELLVLCPSCGRILIAV